MTRAIFQALLVTFLWSTSWVIIKIGLKDIPALPFAGLRYTLAFFCLLPMAATRWSEVKNLTRRDWQNLAVLGVLFYTLTQGAQFLALEYLPAVTLSLLLNFSAVAVALLGILFLAETPNWMQWTGIGIFLAGVLLYFYPVSLPQSEVLGLVVGFSGVLTNAGGALLGRYVNRAGHIPAFVVTVVSMGIGAILLLVIGIAVEGLPELSLLHWGMILWLAVMNTAFAFTLWNHTLRTLSATESSIINNTMLIQIAVLAWVFLGEEITLKEGIALLVAAAGILLTSWAGGKPSWNPLSGFRRPR